MVNELEELRLAEAQGERTLMSLRPGDSFMWKGYQTIDRMQWDQKRESIFVTTTPTDDYPRGRTFLLHGLLMFPSFLTDAHAAQERQALEDW